VSAFFLCAKLARTRNRTKGSALLVVLLMLGTVAVVASAVARAVSGAAMEAGAMRLPSDADADLRAGIELGAAAILGLDEDVRSADVTADLAGRRISVHVANERGRIDLNMAAAPLFAALLRAGGLDNTEAERFAANIVDWRGGVVSASGAVAEDDSAKPLQFGGATAPTGSDAKEAPKQAVGTHLFFHPIQLATVPGFTKSLVKSILPLLTVASGAGQVDPFISPAAVLRVLPGTSASKVDAFIEARRGNVGRDTALLMLGMDKALVTSRASDGWRLQIVIRAHGRRRVREAVIAIVRNDSDLYRVLYVDDDPDPTTGLNP